MSASEKSTVTFQAPPDLVARVKSEAERTGRSGSSVIRVALMDALTRSEAPDNSSYRAPSAPPSLNRKEPTMAEQAQSDAADAELFEIFYGDLRRHIGPEAPEGLECACAWTARIAVEVALAGQVVLYDEEHSERLARLYISLVATLRRGVTLLNAQGDATQAGRILNKTDAMLAHITRHSPPKGDA